MNLISWPRLFAVIKKEFMQMRRDKATFAMMIGIPLIQLILFGFAIDLNPKHLPAAVVMQQPNPIAQDILQRMEQSQYFKFIKKRTSLVEAKKMLHTNQVKFVVYFPPNFYRDAVKGLQPSILLLVDGSDPIAAGRPASVFNELSQIVGRDRFRFLSLPAENRVYKTVVLSAFNPEVNTAFHIVPGLMGVVLTMTMVVVTALAITREFERGTMELLLSTPLQPLEVMIGKILPYACVGYIQVSFILLLGRLLFHLPMHGSFILLFLMCFPFICANLAMGLTFSTLATNQLQAMQSAMFFFLPSILLSGFMFPFQGMPTWAQMIGNCLPLTHFLVIVRGIVLRGNGWAQIYPDLLYILAFMMVVMSIAYKRYRNTLD
ncbi:MAG TPA: mannose-1-phosphate guanyltransferase [Legionellales bacterium]|nr:mannose-1-phosphate guanyltransferase [Legionellales bacterium]